MHFVSSQDSWLLIPRHGSASKLGIPEVVPQAEAVVFGATERDQLCSYLCQRDKSIGSVSSDLYSVSVNGSAIVTWDHHTADGGLRIDLRHVDTASTLLTELNRLGAELELFYTDG